MICTYDVSSGTPVLMNESEGRPADDRPLWLHLANPSAEECRAVGEEFSIPQEHLRAALDRNERPRAEYADDVLLVIVRAPYRQSISVPFSTFPIALVLTPRAVVTISLKEGVVEALLCRPIPGKGLKLLPRLALAFLLRVSTTFIDTLHFMDEHVAKIEHSLKESMRNQELIRMLHVEKSLIYFLTALKGNQLVLDKIASQPPFAAAEERAFLDDVVIENKQATDMAEIFSHILESLGDAFGAIVSNNLNKVMKVLTGLTIVLMIPNIIAAVYGMNVELPLQESKHAFWLISIVCLAISFVVFYILKRKDWM